MAISRKRFNTWIGDTTPTSARENQIWINTSSDSISRYNGTAWIPVGVSANSIISQITGSAPSTLDTLDEIATALNDNPNILDLYLTSTSASATYLTQASASTGYMSITNPTVFVPATTDEWQVFIAFNKKIPSVEAWSFAYPEQWAARQILDGYTTTDEWYTAHANCYSLPFFSGTATPSAIGSQEFLSYPLGKTITVSGSDVRNGSYLVTGAVKIYDALYLQINEVLSTTPIASTTPWNASLVGDDQNSALSSVYLSQLNAATTYLTQSSANSTYATQNNLSLYATLSYVNTPPVILNRTSTSYTFGTSDARRMVTSSNASPVTFTIPPQSSVAWDNNTILRVANYGAGALSIAGGSGVTVTNSSSTLSQYQSAMIVRTSSNAWTVIR